LDALDEIEYDYPNRIAPVGAIEYTIKKLLGYGVDTTRDIMRGLWMRIYRAQVTGKEYEKALKTILKLSFGPYCFPSNRQAARITALKGLIGMMEICLRESGLRPREGGASSRSGVG
jgi:hypothetical protein